MKFGLQTQQASYRFPRAIDSISANRLQATLRALAGFSATAAAPPRISGLQFRAVFLSVAS
jgi:hypothetical protein